MINKQRIILRADGNSKIGLGHIYRCLAIAEMLSGNGEIIFAIRTPSSAIEKLIKSYCDSVLILQEATYLNEANELNKLLDKEDLVILDGYKFETSYQEVIKLSGARLICIDDIINYHFMADVIINHAGGIDEKLYDKEEYTKLFLGPSYAIVRSEFWNASVPERQSDNNVFICLGGADPNNDLIYVLQKAYTQDPFLNYHIITGSAFMHETTLFKFLIAKTGFYLYKNLNAAEIKELMQICSRAICSPSTVSYEYLCIGGELYLHPIADNQSNIFKYFIKEDLALSFDEFKTDDNVRIKKMLIKQKQIFDGKTHERIKAAILNE